MADAVQDGAKVKVPPPLVFVGMIVIGIGVQSVWPVTFGWAWPVRFGAAFVFLASAFPLVASAMRLFRASGQQPEPWKPTPSIVTTGAYRFTRNPMYVGLALVQAAVGVAAANAWIVAFVPVACVLVYFVAIRHEEAYLAEKFGAAYLDYKAPVRRWL